MSILRSKWLRAILLSFYLWASFPQPVYAATVASGLMVPWPSTNASIPAGWTRETQLDALYVQGPVAGADTDLTTARGAANHAHTMGSHLHTVSSGNSTGSTSTDNEAICGDVGSSANSTHSHGSGNGASTTATIQTTSNDMAGTTVIWIKSDGTPTGIPSNAYAFFASDTLPTSWTRVQGNNYLKGAAAAGDGGAAIGGAITHTHTENAHLHVGANSAKSTTAETADPDLGGFFAAFNGAGHAHVISMNNATATLQSSNGEPVFKKLNIINNGTGGVDFPTKVIALWNSTNASIPTDWTRFTSMDTYFVKGANANGESNVTTGGAATHTHTGNAHSHATPHVDTTNTEELCDICLGVCGASPAADTHTHTWTGTNATDSAPANTSESGYPSYRRAIFVEYNPSAVTRRIWMFSQLPISHKEVLA